MTTKTLASVIKQKQSNIIPVSTNSKRIIGMQITANPTEKQRMNKLKRMEDSGEIDKVGRLISAAHIIAKCSDLLFMESQDILMESGYYHHELKQAYNKWEASIDQVTRAYRGMFKKANQENPGQFFAEVERLFPRLAKLLDIYDIAGELASPKSEQEVVLPSDRGEKKRCSFYLPEWDKQRLQEIASQYNVSLNEMLGKICQSFIINNPVRKKVEYKTV